MQGTTEHAGVIGLTVEVALFVPYDAGLNVGRNSYDERTVRTIRDAFSFN